MRPGCVCVSSELLMNTVDALKTISKCQYSLPGDIPTNSPSKSLEMHAHLAPIVVAKPAFHHHLFNSFPIH